VPEFRLTVPYEEGVRRTVNWIDLHKPVLPLAGETAEDRLIAAWDKFAATAPRA